MSIARVVGTAAFTLWALPAAAQAPRVVPDMQAIAKALGVECNYCHAGQRGGGAQAVTLSGKPRLAVAREMIDMTGELNARVQTMVGKDAANTTRVECVTCHRGVAIPKQMREIIVEATVRQSPEAAVALYRDLRTRYYGRQSYDFSEDTLLEIADRLTQGRPAGAIALADLNLEYNPRSARSYLIRGIAQSRSLATVDLAIESFNKVLEIEPDNGIARGWLYQTEQLRKRRTNP